MGRGVVVQMTSALPCGDLLHVYLCATHILNHCRYKEYIINTLSLSCLWSTLPVAPLCRCSWAGPTCGDHKALSAPKRAAKDRKQQGAT